MLFLHFVRETVLENASRIAALGNWPAWIKAEDSLGSRIPDGDKTAPGFDAGIACALDLIPRDKQKLAATLHAAYTPEAVAQVRRESVAMDPDSETCWWLAACIICCKGVINATTFFGQLERFHAMAEDPGLRRTMALIVFAEMSESFETDTYDAPFGVKDGCIQGAYVAGHPFGTQYAEAYGIFFIGTYLPSLGLEEFPWSEKKDDQGRPLSGPVHGSKQFVKCSDVNEFRRAIEVVRSHLL